MLKKCNKCGKEFPATKDHFYGHPKHKYGLRNDCKTCRDAYVNDWVSKNRDKREIIKLRSRCKSYGIDVRDYERLLVKQNYCCAVCGIHISKLTRRLDIDHNHITGKVRGLLCQSCNTVLGKVKEDTQVLQNLLNYLGKWNR